MSTRNDLLQTAVIVDAVENKDSDDLVVVMTNGGEGEYVISANAAASFATLLKALGYTAEIEELDSAAQHNDSNESTTETF